MYNVFKIAFSSFIISKEFSFTLNSMDELCCYLLKYIFFKDIWVLNYSKLSVENYSKLSFLVVLNFDIFIFLKMMYSINIPFLRNKGTPFIYILSAFPFKIRK